MPVTAMKSGTWAKFLPICLPFAPAYAKMAAHFKRSHPAPENSMSSPRTKLANAIRVLSMDAVQKAKSGHPGAPMGMADIAEVLWNDYLRHNPANPAWPGRDRFVLSNGHGSMLLYSLLHLSGYDLPLAELQNFRQLHSKTPGHPEYGYTPGVETTTGPLGQGLANAVGMALAEKVLAAQFNRPGHAVVDHHTYVFLGDGCLMEGISHEASSLAGTLGLGKLIAFYDDNGISIDGEVEGWFTDDTPARFRAYGWQVIAAVDGHNADAVKAAIETARGQTDKPTLICCKTIIGKGAPNKQGTEAAHGSPLGEDEVAATRVALGWEYGPFEIPADIYAGWDARKQGAAREQEWDQAMAAYAAGATRNWRPNCSGAWRASCPRISRSRPRPILPAASKRVRASPRARRPRIASMPSARCCRNCSVVPPIWRVPTSPSGQAQRV